MLRTLKGLVINAEKLFKELSTVVRLIRPFRGLGDEKQFLAVYYRQSL